MKDNLTRSLRRYAQTFSSFSTGQKAVALVGSGALLLAGFLVFSWASKPSYAPLYSGLSGEDAAAVIEELETQGIPYEISGGGDTVMVPRADVYTTRIALSGEGLPTSSDSGYSLLDGQDLSTSEFQERTGFKRAMEGELARTIEAIDGVSTAVVHLALPEKAVFTDEQDPATASVLIKTAAGEEMGPEQVQAVVHLVASSIEGMNPSDVTVADATGRVLSTPDDASGAAATTRAQQVAEYQAQMQSKIQAVLDRVVGPGNSSVNVTADLDFDKSVTDRQEYIADPDLPPLSETESTETYNGPADGANAMAGGVVGPDGQMEPGAAGGDGESDYANTNRTTDNAVGQVVEHRETAPGSVRTMHLGIVIDSASVGPIQPQDIRDLVAASVGINPDRGDTIEVSAMPFDRSAEEAAAEELAAAEAAAAKARQMEWIRNLGLAAVVLLIVLFVWLRSRRRARAREEATTYVVEQLRADAAARAAAIEPASPALAALEAAEDKEDSHLREELNALVEKQPEDVASLLRGWLVEPR